MTNSDLTPDQQPDQPRPVDALADAFVEAWAALDPVTATKRGISGYDHLLTDYSPDGHAAREALARRTYGAMAAATPVDERERAAQEAFLERVGLQVERYDAGIIQSRISVIESGLHSIRACFDLMDTGSEEGWVAIDARLAAVPAALDGLRAGLLHEAGRGNVAPAQQMLHVADQVASWTGRSGPAPSVFTMLVDQAEDGALKEQLVRHAGAATESVAAFGRFLAEELAPRGAPREAVGRDAYALHSRHFLGATVDLEETYAWGFEELARIEAEMAEVARQIVPGGSVDDAVAALDADPAQRVEGKEAFRDWMQHLSDAAVAELAGTHFDIPEPIRRLECCIAPTTDGAIYYTGPSEDFTRPGRMWWAVPAETTWFSKWREVTTVYHEGVPGHHLQIGQTTYRRDVMNRWLRQLCWVSGSGEGWALYAERLMDDLGYLDDPADKLGMLDAQAFRAGRVIVDIGMHLELEIPRDNPFGFHPGERWNPSLGYDLMRAHSRIDDAQLRFEVNRYLGWPGQAPSYKVGERLWLEARADAQARAGASFDLKAFHSAALNLGSIGLDPLAKALARL